MLSIQNKNMDRKKLKKRKIVTFIVMNAGSGAGIMVFNNK